MTVPATRIAPPAASPRVFAFLTSRVPHGRSRRTAGGDHNSGLSPGDGGRQGPLVHHVVLDDQLRAARAAQPTDVAARGRALAEHHRKHDAVRLGTRPADRAQVPAPLLRGRLSGVHVDAVLLRLRGHSVEQNDVGRCLRIDAEVPTYLYSKLCRTQLFENNMFFNYCSPEWRAKVTIVTTS